MMFSSSIPRLLSGIPLHSDDDWMVALGPVIDVPMAWQMGVEACMTPSGPLVTAYTLIIWNGSLLIIGISSSASVTAGLLSAHCLASSSSVLGVIGTQSQLISYAWPSSSALFHCQSMISASL